MNTYLVIALGFLAQVLFFTRTIIQWFKSESEGTVFSPVLFWQISLVASLIMLTYGVLRNDFAIVVGQSLVYSIYIRNLQLKNAWTKMHFLSRALAIIVPLAYWAWLIYSGNFSAILNNKDITLFWVFWGTIAQVVFISRFFYQWIYSENKKESVLPLGFWLISAAGSLMIFTYAIIRSDLVLFVGHSFGLFVYSRNIFLHFGRKGILSRIDTSSKLNSRIERISDKIK